MPFMYSEIKTLSNPWRSILEISIALLKAESGFLKILALFMSIT